jgi:hypothetical protein
VLYLRLIILSVEGDVPVNSETLLVTDFVNLKIKPAQSFRCAHKGKMCVRIFIGVSARTCMRIYVCTVFLKNLQSCNFTFHAQKNCPVARIHGYVYYPQSHLVGSNMVSVSSIVTLHVPLILTSSHRIVSLTALSIFVWNTLTARVGNLLVYDSRSSWSSIS